MPAPVIVTIRPGVQFTAAAGASFRRVEAELGRRADVNSTYRDYSKQLKMFNDWNAYAAGKGPHPGHSRALHPDYSVHCLGLALDSDDWRTPGFNELMARHGWIRTAAGDPTERHHYEYQWWRDQHRGDPAPAGGDKELIEEETEDDMAKPVIITSSKGIGIIIDWQAGTWRGVYASETANHEANGAVVTKATSDAEFEAIKKSLRELKPNAAPATVGGVTFPAGFTGRFTD